MKNFTDLISFQNRLGNYYPFPYIFNNLQNRVLVGSSNSQFIFSYTQIEILFSKSFPYYNYQWTFAMIPDNSGFVVGRSDGLMMLFKTFSVSDVDNNRSNKVEDTFYTFPNPTNDFIIVKISEIYNLIVSDLNGIDIDCIIDYSKDKVIE